MTVNIITKRVYEHFFMSLNISNNFIFNHSTIFFIHSSCLKTKHNGKVTNNTIPIMHRIYVIVIVFHIELWTPNKSFVKPDQYILFCQFVDNFLLKYDKEFCPSPIICSKVAGNINIDTKTLPAITKPYTKNCL